jgi:Ethanolamine utilization protein EutJ (predicted chaperonin)
VSDDRRVAYARAIWDAMVDDEPNDVDERLLWEGGYLDAADAVIKLVDQELSKVESVLVAADRVREAYEAMIDGRSLGRLPDFEARR